MKGPINKMTSSWNDQLTKWLADELPNQWNDKFMKW